jgi:hypothetical protein
MSEGEGIILGFDIRRGGEPFKDVLRGEGVFLISSMGGGGMDLFWNAHFGIER